MITLVSGPIVDWLGRSGVVSATKLHQVAWRTPPMGGLHRLSQHGERLQ